MQYRADDGTNAQRSNSGQTLLLVVVCVLGLAVIGGGMRTIMLLERIVLVSERMEARAVAAIEAAKPVGKAAVEKGTAVLEGIDANDLSQAATKGAKEVGAAAKEKLLKKLHLKDEPNAPDDAATTRPTDG